MTQEKNQSKKNRSCALWFTWFFLLAPLTSCTHRKGISDFTMKELQTQVETILVKKLNDQPDFVKVNEFNIEEVVTNAAADTVTMTYHVSFDSESKKNGRVTHGSQAKVTLVQKSEREWTLKSTEPGSQELIFQDSFVLGE